MTERNCVPTCLQTAKDNTRTHRIFFHNGFLTEAVSKRHCLDTSLRTLFLSAGFTRLAMRLQQNNCVNVCPKKEKFMIMRSREKNTRGDNNDDITHGVSGPHVKCAVRKPVKIM